MRENIRKGKMGKTPKFIGIAGLVLLLAVCILYFQLGETSIPDQLPKNTLTTTDSANLPAEENIAVRRKSPRDLAARKFEKERDTAAPSDESIEAKQGEEERAEKDGVAHPRYIEEIKKQIYERNIDSVDEIALLDELVQTGDKDTRQFWGDGWTSVDDWKKTENGFKLERKDDGTLMFAPDAETAKKYTFFENPRAYTYDEVNREFVNEVDYYGKTIYNVAKFINDDVLVFMTISGTKVDLNIYQKNANQGVN